MALVDSQEEMLTAIFYLMWESQPVDAADLALRLLAFDEPTARPRDDGKMFFCKMAAQSLLHEMRAGRKTPEDRET